jgi:hypothetical protein
MMHGPARQSAHAIRCNLIGMVSQAKTEARKQKEAVAEAAAAADYPISHRDAAAGVRGVQQRLQRLVFRIYTSIGPKRVVRHESSGQTNQQPTR